MNERCLLGLTFFPSFVSVNPSSSVTRPGYQNGGQATFLDYYIIYGGSGGGDGVNDNGDCVNADAETKIPPSLIGGFNDHQKKAAGVPLVLLRAFVAQRYFLHPNSFA